ncbi:NAD(P)-binding protein [Teratosphaeria destructans]|uniref:NAD(P)-binding protein n=1 Tax=Teratosphaeria destructans TaxID=418781 RepID=A0A9W7W3L2_9PEZI|nr:NAD(P)-binding protein [Teratosphaeria destructans]
MSSIKNVTVAGVNGAVGPDIVNALLQAGFNLQLFTRPSSTKPHFPGAKVVEIDYEDRTAVERALHGQDAVVSALGATAMGAQETLIHASIAAGVKRFFPSEYGCDLANPRVNKFPVFADKVKHEALLTKLANEHQDFSYTLIYNGPFLDWGIISAPLLLNVGDKSAEVFDAGDVPFSATRTGTIGKAVAGALLHAEKTKNRALYIHDAIVTQNQLIERAERLTQQQFKKVPVDSQALETESWALVQDPSANPMTWIFNFIKIGIFAKEELCKWDKSDNELVGIQELKGAELEDVLDGILAKAIKN